MKSMHSPGINGERELRGNRQTQVHLENWPLKQSMCVCVIPGPCVQKSDAKIQLVTTLV